MVGEVEVMPTEKMVIAAGKFEAQEVVARGRYVDPKSNESSRYQTRAWFVPEVGFWVKQDFLERNKQDTADSIRTKVVLKAYQLQPR